MRRSEAARRSEVEKPEGYSLVFPKPQAAASVAKAASNSTLVIFMFVIWYYSQLSVFINPFGKSCGIAYSWVSFVSLERNMEIVHLGVQESLKYIPRSFHGSERFPEFQEFQV
jgi:hypothetical protein